MSAKPRADDKVPDRTFENREAFPRDVDHEAERRPPPKENDRFADRRRAVDAPDAGPPRRSAIDRT